MLGGEGGWHFTPIRGGQVYTYVKVIHCSVGYSPQLPDILGTLKGTYCNCV